VSLLRILGTHRERPFCAGMIFRRDRIVETAPILGLAARINGWSVRRFVEWARRMGWTVRVVPGDAS